MCSARGSESDGHEEARRNFAGPKTGQLWRRSGFGLGAAKSELVNGRFVNVEGYLPFALE